MIIGKKCWDAFSLEQSPHPLYHGDLESLSFVKFWQLSSDAEGQWSHLRSYFELHPPCDSSESQCLISTCKILLCNISVFAIRITFLSVYWTKRLIFKLKIYTRLRLFSFHTLQHQDWVYILEAMQDDWYLLFIISSLSFDYLWI